MSERVTLELIFAQGQRVLEEIREVRAEQRQRFGAIHPCTIVALGGQKAYSIVLATIRVWVLAVLAALCAAPVPMDFVHGP